MTEWVEWVMEFFAQWKHFTEYVHVWGGDIQTEDYTIHLWPLQNDGKSSTTLMQDEASSL